NVDNIHAYIKNVQEENRNAKWRSFCLFPVTSEQNCIAVVYLLFNKTYRLNEQDVEIGRKYFQRAGAILHNSIKDNTIRYDNTRFEHILDSAADPVVCLDARGDITYFNERFSQLTGFAADEIRDRNVDAFLLNGSEIFNRIRSQLLAEHEIITIESDICCKGESLLTLDWSFSRMKDACNKMKCYIGVGKDIREQGKNRIQKQQFNRDTEELIFKLAHRLKTPLVSHDGYISLLEREYQNQLPDGGRFYLKKLHENNEHMCNVIDDLLDYCKQQNKETRHELVNTRTLISEIIKDLYDVEHIHFHLSDDLPKVNFDKGDLLTIFTNLLENAVKYMGQRRDPRVEIGGQKENSGSYFYVKDNGIGIDAKYHKHIFDPFFRVKDQINVEGTGIGLTVVQNIIRRNNGEIRVESTPGQGTTIFFTIRDMQ
ncbi:PAS domain S-box protein, partial [candidate division KSB1 bacterium]|nr:PAS domain S-box protein [candidate division KSB1 bacterium]